MRNFIQFIVPILVIFVGGLLFYIYSKPIDASKNYISNAIMYLKNGYL